MTPIFFICERGLRKISLPPVDDHSRSFQIKITSCDDGCLIETDMDFDLAIEKLNAFQGRQITWIYCDTNEIVTRGTFKSASRKTDRYGASVIYLSYAKNN